MGKTAAGAVWLDAEMLSAYDYWQFWRNTEDGDVGRFLRLFTEVPLAEVERLEAKYNNGQPFPAVGARELPQGRPMGE